MKKIFWVLAFVLNLSLVQAQNSLSGKIYDYETQKTLPLATIYFIDLHRGAATDTSGYYHIENLPSGKFHIEVRMLGYNSIITQIEIKGDMAKDFQLKESHLEMKTVMVTGVSVATETKLNPVPSIGISALKLQEGTSTNIIDAISQQAGINQITTGAGISKPVIRGLGFNRVLVLQNSIRQEGQQWGDEHGIEIDEYSVNHVEIIKGPGSLAYGSDAMAGVINLLSAPTQIGFGNYQKLTYKTAFHSNNLLQVHSLQYDGNTTNLHWGLQGTRKQAGNYSNAYDGKVYNSGFAEWNGNGYLHHNFKRGFLGLKFSSFNQEVGIIEGERDSLENFLKPVVVNDSTLEEATVADADLNGYGIGIPKQEIHHHKISTNGKFFLPKGALQFTLGAQQNNRKEYEYHLHDGHIEDEAAIDMLLNTGTYDLNYHQHLKEWETTFGVNGYTQAGKNQGEEYIIPDYQLNDIGIYALTQRKYKRWYFAGGIRYNYRKVNGESLYLDSNGNEIEAPISIGVFGITERFESFQKDFSALAYSAGLSYNINENIIARLNYASGFRAPNMAELGSNGAHEGTFRYEKGNIDLKPETSQQIDFSISAETLHFNLEVNAFYNGINNFIYSRKVLAADGSDSLIISEDEANRVFAFVQDNAYLYGGEITMDLHPHPFDWIHFENSFSLVNAEIKNGTDSTKYLPFTPSPRWQSEIRAHAEKLGKHWQESFISINLSHQWAQNRVFIAYNTETTTPAYTLLNVSIGTDCVNKKGKKLFSFVFSAQNLTNVTYQNHLSRLKYLSENTATGRTGVFNMGRNYMVKIIVPITLKSKP